MRVLDEQHLDVFCVRRGWISARPLRAIPIIPLSALALVLSSLPVVLISLAHILPLVEGRYTWSDGRYVDVFDSTVVELLTDEGLAGYGEFGVGYMLSNSIRARLGVNVHAMNSTTGRLNPSSIDSNRVCRDDGQLALDAAVEDAVGGLFADKAVESQLFGHPQ